MSRSSLPAALALLLAACAQPSDKAGPDKAGTPRDTVVVFSASSLSVPLRAVLDSFANRTNAVVQLENGASLELARRITELHRVPDLIALADHEVFPQLLMPGATSWYTKFARNRMVIAFTDHSRGAAEVSAANWHQVVQRPKVRLGRADPVLAPAGYRTLLLYRLAEQFYQLPGLAARLESLTPPTLQRANAVELAALLSAGELDYIIEYESLARANRFKFLALPPEIDLGDQGRAADYARVSVRVGQRADTVTLRGAPITYGASVPRDAPHRDAGLRLLAFMLGEKGKALLRSRSVDALDRPENVGDSIPALVRQATQP